MMKTLSDVSRETGCSTGRLRHLAAKHDIRPARWIGTTQVFDEPAYARLVELGSVPPKIGRPLGSRPHLVPTA